MWREQGIRWQQAQVSLYLYGFCVCSTLGKSQPLYMGYQLSPELSPRFVAFGSTNTLITAVPVEMGSLDCVQGKILSPHSWDCGSILPHCEQPCIESSYSRGGWAVAGVLEVECHFVLGCCDLPTTEVVLEVHNSCAPTQLLLGVSQEKLKTDPSACWGWKESIPLFQWGLGSKSPFSAAYWNKHGFQFTPPVDNLWLQNIMVQWYHKDCEICWKLWSHKNNVLDHYWKHDKTSNKIPEFFFFT